jgi:hypothetical protein
VSSTILDEDIHSTLGKHFNTLGTITKCLSLRHFESFPQIDAQSFRWHFRHPLSKIGYPGASSKASAVGPWLATTKWHL